MQKVTAAADSAEAKFAKYFHPQIGRHPSLGFVKQVQCFNPRKSLFFGENLLSCFSGIAKIPQIEIIGYRHLAQDYT